MQYRISDVLIGRKVGFLHARGDKEVLIVKLFNGFSGGALNGLTQNDIVSVRVLLTPARRKVHFTVAD